MSRPEQIAIVTTGTELVRGIKTDSNGPNLARSLEQRGYTVRSIYTLPDDPGILKSVIGHLLQEKNVRGIIMTGGLGATADDCTVDVLAAITGRPVVTDTVALEKVRALLSRGKSDRTNALMEQQARTLKGTHTLPNDTGLAPGLLLDLNEGEKKTWLAALPGVPVEMRTMFEAYLSSEIARRMQPQKRFRSGFYIYGMGETKFQATYFQKLNLSSAQSPDEKDYTWGITAKPGELQLSFDCNSKEISDAMLLEVKRIFPKHYLASTVASSLRDLCIQTKISVGLAESCTGGLIAKMITDESGASSYFAGGLVAYDNSVKQKSLAVKKETLDEFGAVSSECATEMAIGAVHALDCDYSLSITGIAGPGGGTNAKPVGTVFIACASWNGVVLNKNLFYPQDRNRIRVYTANTGLHMLYRFIVQEEARRVSTRSKK